MSNRKSFAIVLFTALIVAGFHSNALAQTASQEAKDTSIANISSAGASVRWDLKTSSSGATLTVAAPDGRVFRKELKAGATPEFTIIDQEGNRLPDGQYTYEIRLSSLVSKQARAARGKDDDPESIRSARKRAVLPDHSFVQSGSFSILNGAIFVAGPVEEAGARPTSKITEQPRMTETTRTALTKLRQHHRAAMLMPDDVIPDDLIVQGSSCVGLDCVNGEVFGFDTIRLKENNDRIQFDDTSTTAGFPTNNWQIRANSSASGGASFLAFVDQGASGNSETGTIVFEVDAGAPANSLKVSSTGRVGLRTATPVLDLHITTSDTPAHRLEQTNAGGFTAQTWDVAGNEANFFVRDVTGGSRLPFRIRPGAPTSSIDINALGNVGIGTASPDTRLSVLGSGATFPTTYNIGEVATFVAPADSFTSISLVKGGIANPQGLHFGVNQASLFSEIQASRDGIATNTLALNRQGGNVGIGTSAPTELLSVNGSAGKPGGGSWSVFSDERLKTIKGRFSSGLKALMQMQPLRYEYRRDNALGINSVGEHVGFGAQTVQKVIPEAVTRNENGYLQVNNDPILWTMLNAIKEQQKEIEQLKGQVRQLRAASRRRR
ncbi:MAG: tail fiber domain-containing protein [Pyrinomonadaceae bacterium]|nr:tail fiber domain-containing protein [Pyrinomonadaceae bacterium]